MYYLCSGFSQNGIFAETNLQLVLYADNNPNAPDGGVSELQLTDSTHIYFLVS